GDGRGGARGGRGGGRGLRRAHELGERQVDRHRLAALRRVPDLREGHECAASRLGQLFAVAVRKDPVLRAVDDEHRALHAPRQRELLLAREAAATAAVRRSDERLRVGLEPPADAVLDLLGRVRLAEHVPHPPLDEVGIPPAPVLGVELAPALRRERPPVEERSQEPAPMSRQRTERRLTGNIGPMNAAAATRFGCSAASRSAHCAPFEKLTTTERSVPVASRTAIASFTYSASWCAASSLGRSDLPLPRGSNATTRAWRAKYGICIFHTRECTTIQAGRKRIVGSPAPYASQWICTPARSTNPSWSG